MRSQHPEKKRPANLLLSLPYRCTVACVYIEVGDSQISKTIRHQYKQISTNVLLNGHHIDHTTLVILRTLSLWKLARNQILYN